MSHLKNYATKSQHQSGKITYRVVCQDQADVQAAVALGLGLTTERLHGRDMRIAFSSESKPLAAHWQTKVNKAAQSIRDKQCSDPSKREEVKQLRKAAHEEHQALRAKYLNARQQYRNRSNY